MKADYEIRQETEKDYPQVFKLVEEAFRDMKESDHREQFLVERLRHSPAFVPELSLVADGDGGVVGYGLMTSDRGKACIDAYHRGLLCV